jgi:NAD(P)-dependent dehydrogenase (short-subunit alcohol dehydrogenase family)
MQGIAGQVAMITGATGNLGRATARVFLQEGARVALIGHNGARLRGAYPHLVESSDAFLSDSTDLTRVEHVERAVEAAFQALGPIDILANIAGGYRGGKPIHETDPKELDFLFRLNVHTAYLTSRALVPQMLDRGSGVIINIGARPGQEGRARLAAYAAAKSAVIRLTESMAKEFQQQGLRVNCVLPGTIDTPENREAMPKADRSQWVPPEAIADVILFLASHGARAITGAAVPVYGRS